MKTLVLAVLMSAPAFAQADVASLYELSTDGSSASVKAGQKGVLVLEIRPKKGAHVSDEAPLKIELSGKGATFDKQKLALADAVARTPRFEAPFSATDKGKASLEAKLTFFICTDTACNRQQKTVSVPVDVN